MRTFLVLALLLLAAPVSAQPVVPDTVVMGKTLSDYLQAFNSGEAAQMDTFKTAHHFDVPVENMQRIFRQTGGINLLKIETSDAISIVSLAQEKESDRTLRLTIKEIGTAETPKLSVLLEGVPRPIEYAIPRLTLAEAISMLDARIDALTARDKFSGVMLVERNGKTIFQKARGMADRDATIAVTPRTKFRIGSMNKMFTAVSALQLVAARKLSLDGTVGDYLPDYPNQEIAQKVTIRMLLTHSGGTGDFFGPEFDKNRLTLKHNQDYVALFGTRAPLFEPGSQRRYSNYGFILLGHIVQRVSGEDYYDYVRNHIFRPAGMTGTESLSEDVAVAGRSKGYMFKDGAWSPNTNTLPYRGTAAGGGYSTTGDLVKFGRALETGKLLSKASLEQATRSQIKEAWYGYGFSVSGEGATHWYGHNGGAPGMNGELRIFPESRVIVVALSNLDPPAATVPVDFYANRMPLN